ARPQELGGGGDQRDQRRLVDVAEGGMPPADDEVQLVAEEVVAVGDGGVQEEGGRGQDAGDPLGPHLARWYIIPAISGGLMPRITRREILAAAPALGIAAVVASAAVAGAEQLHMDAALDHLRAARKELDLANADKGGHRGNAIRLVNNAITEVERGIEYARKH